MKKRVLVQFKLSMADKASFQQDEWGPWEYTWVDHLDDATRPFKKRVYHFMPDIVVKRSTAAGVEMIRGYPDVDECPEVEDWLPSEKSSMTKVFDDMERWVFSDTASTSKYRRHWESLRAWHTAYSTSDSIAVGMMHKIDSFDELALGGCPAMSWSA
eukprot:6003197-Pleurochrysis_carterae.AAC.1